jgi:hypothetical protein
MTCLVTLLEHVIPLRWLACVYPDRRHLADLTDWEPSPYDDLIRSPSLSGRYDGVEHLDSTSLRRDVPHGGSTGYLIQGSSLYNSCSSSVTTNIQRLPSIGSISTEKPTEGPDTTWAQSPSDDHLKAM